MSLFDSEAFSTDGFDISGRNVLVQVSERSERAINFGRLEQTRDEVREMKWLQT